jgi:hypothetical protein
MRPEDRYDPTEAPDYLGPRETIPLWRWRPARIVATVIASIVAWEAGWAWQNRSGYEIDIVAQMSAGGSAWGPDLFIGGEPVRTKHVVRDAFGETWLRLHDPVRVPARPTKIVVQGSTADGKQVIPLNVRARGRKCAVVVDLRGPQATAGACVGTSAYEEF